MGERLSLLLPTLVTGSVVARATSHSKGGTVDDANGKILKDDGAGPAVQGSGYIR